MRSRPPTVGQLEAGRAGCEALGFSGICGRNLKIALTLTAHLLGLPNSFAHTITNAVSEGFSSKIKAIRPIARVIRPFVNRRFCILIQCGNLVLLPAISGQ